MSSDPQDGGLPSDGLFPPYNAPGSAAVSPGVQPGASSGIDLAQYVVIFGATGGMFVYAGTPALGNPPVYSVSNASKDPYGNPVFPGIWAGNTTSAQAGFQVSGTDGRLFFLIPGAFSSDANIFVSQGVSAGALFQVSGPADASPDGDRVEVSLYSAKAGFGTAAALRAGYFDTNGVFEELFEGSFDGFRIATAKQITAVAPGTGTSRTNVAQSETWHSITMDSGWSALSGYDTPRYRLLPDGSIQFSGSAQFTGTPGNPQNLNSSNPLPSAYWPQNNHYFRSGDIHRMGAQYQTNGVLQAYPISGGVSQVAIDAVVSNQ